MMIQGDARSMANQIRMERQVFKGAFVIVEGRDDKLCLQQHTSAKDVEIIVAQGKENVIETIEILDEDADFDGALGIVDADFDRIQYEVSSSNNLFSPECHDLVMMHIINSPLDDVMVEYGSRLKISSLDTSVLNLLVHSAIPIGYLRLYSLRANLNLRFSNLSFTSFINRNTLAIDRLNLIREVRNKSGRYDLNDFDLEQRLTEIESAAYAFEEVCCGEDLVEILSIGFRKLLGNHNSRNVDPVSLKRALRLAMPTTTFRETQLGVSLVDWQNRNPSYRLFEA